MTTSALSLEAVKRELPGGITRLGWTFFVIGVVLCIVAYASDANRAALNNIVILMFIASLAGGAVFLIALEYISGAVWSVPMRRINEFLAGLTPVAPLLAIPIFFHMHDVFHWTHVDAMAGDPVLASKSAYLNVCFFVIRYVIVFILWIAFYLLFVRNSTRQDESKDPRLTTINTRLAAAFLPLFALSLTVIALDWSMSLEPHWYSTIFGVYYFSGTALAAVAAATLVIVPLYEKGHLPGLRRDHLYSLGALMFAFVNFWAYIAFSQFMLIWYANLPEETMWFMKRWQDGWQIVSILLIVMHFGVPYFALLPQDAKMNPRRLKIMAAWILVAHLLDMYWMVMPASGPKVPMGWQELGFAMLAAGLVIVVLSWTMRRSNLMPIGDPKLERGLGFRL